MVPLGTVPKKQWKALAVAALALFSALFWLWASVGFPVTKQVCEKAANHADGNCPSYNVGLIALWKIGEALSDFTFLAAIITAIATIYIARFTLRLKQSTDRLWDAGERQIALVAANFDKEIAENRAIAERNWEQMGQSIAATLEAAEAATSQAQSAARQAKIAEDLFLKTERPYVLVTSFSYISPPRVTEDVLIDRPHVTFKIGNFGRTAALIHDIRHVFQVADGKSVPTNPFSGHQLHPILAEPSDAGYAIAAGQVIEDQHFELPDNVPCLEKKGWFDPDLPRGQTVFVFVRIRFEDLSGPIRDRIDTWRYDFGTHRFLKCGGKEHNYEREADRH